MVGDVVLEPLLGRLRGVTDVDLWPVAAAARRQLNRVDVTVFAPVRRSLVGAIEELRDRRLRTPFNDRLEGKQSDSR